MLRVGAGYALGALALVQIGDIVFAEWGFPPWALRALIVTAALGFPVALLLAWFLELGDDGIRIDSTPPGTPRPKVHGLRRYADVAIIGLLLITVAVLLVRQADVDESTPPESPAIAVLPFANLSGDPEQAYFADGLAEELLDQLGRVPGLRVVARNSSFRFRDADADAREIAARLGATSVLQGSVRRSGNRLKLSARLVDGRTGYQIWSGSFDRELTDVFVVQQELAVVVVDALVPAARGEESGPTPPQSADLGAYELYLFGKQATWQRNPASIRRAVSALESSIELDPGFAPAHAQLALSLGIAATYTGTDPTEARKRGETAAYRALALDPQLPAAHLALAGVLREEGSSIDAVLAAIERALQLNPNYAEAIFQYGRNLSLAGRGAEALQWEQKVLQIDPLATVPRTNLILELHRTGDVPERDAEIARYEQLFSDDPDALAWLARVFLWQLDDPVNAARAARRAMQLAPPTPTPGAAIYLFRALVAVGAYEEAGELASRSDWRDTEPMIWACHAALLAGSRGDRPGLDSAIEAVRALPPDPSRAACLAFWLSIAGRRDEAVALGEAASQSRNLRTFTLTGLAMSDVLLADLWSFRDVGPADEVRRLLEDALAAEKADAGRGSPGVNTLLSIAALESMAGRDAAATAALDRAFSRSALPWRFRPYLPWFDRLQGRPEYRVLMARWDAARNEARQRVLADQD